MAAMKATPEKLIKENEEKEVRIKLQEEKIARLIKKLEKWLARSSTKNLESEDDEKASIPSELLTKRHTQRRADNSRTMGPLAT